MSDLNVGLSLARGKSAGSAWRHSEHDGNIQIALGPKRVDVDMQYSKEAVRCDFLIAFESADKPTVYPNALVLPNALQDRIMGAESPAVIFVPTTATSKAGNEYWTDGYTEDKFPNIAAIDAWAQNWISTHVKIDAQGTLSVNPAIPRVVIEEPAESQGSQFAGDFPPPQEQPEIPQTHLTPAHHVQAEWNTGAATPVPAPQPPAWTQQVTVTEEPF